MFSYFFGPGMQPVFAKSLVFSHHVAPHSVLVPLLPPFRRRKGSRTRTDHLLGMRRLAATAAFTRSH